MWGTNPVLELLRARPNEIERIFVGEGLLSPKIAGELLSRAREARVRVDKVPRERLGAMTGGGVHQGVVAEVGQFDYATLDALIEKAKGQSAPVIVVLDGIQDPQNLGAIIRSSHAFGAIGVVVAKDRAAGVTGVVAKASAGALAFCPVARVVNISRALEELKAAGYWTVAADPNSKEALWSGKLNGPLAIVVGAEGPGIRDGVLERCDFRLNIPMSGKVASLNASVSAAVLLYEVTRQRGPATNVQTTVSDA
ncbi:MAG: 23S rRNA (guanosine(2251)-2'-O)-methyltransferase RlmB [Myxococcaceae bacterium]|nr:23S rRNA (guanosine(2251)-2'-O)-methyltransferase RlmB [Myxococcaceae bacterium]